MHVNECMFGSYSTNENETKILYFAFRLKSFATASKINMFILGNATTKKKPQRMNV
jgi:hypothetical protein